jgi:4-hydroxybenzoate polyprenyltransferase
MLADAVGVMRASKVAAFVRLCRPQQWSKNVVVLAGVMFSGEASDPAQVLRALIATFAFCLVSSAIYVFNDWHDRAEDRLHPTKRFRPIASREINAATAFVFGASLLVAATFIGLVVNPVLMGILSLYAGLMLAYTFWFRKLAVIDVLTIAIGFVLRALAGAVAVAVPISAWLFACTMLLALLLGLGKRRQELRMLKGQVENRRPSLVGYAQIDLDRVMLLAGALTVGAYTLYALTVPTFGRDYPMIITVPFVAIAVIRYLFLVFRLNLGSAPEVLVVQDKPLFLSILAWSIAVAVVLAS